MSQWKRSGDSFKSADVCTYRHRLILLHNLGINKRRVQHLGWIIWFYVHIFKNAPHLKLPRTTILLWLIMIIFRMRSVLFSYTFHTTHFNSLHIRRAACYAKSMQVYIIGLRFLIGKYCVSVFFSEQKGIRIVTETTFFCFNTKLEKLDVLWDYRLVRD